MYFRDQFFAQQKRLTQYDTSIEHLLIFPGGTGGNFLSSYTNSRLNPQQANEFRSDSHIGDNLALGWPYYKPDPLTEDQYLKLAEDQCKNWYHAIKVPQLYIAHNYPLFLGAETNSKIKNLYILTADVHGTNTIIDLLLYSKRMMGKPLDTVLDLNYFAGQIQKQTFNDTINLRRWSHIQKNLYNTLLDKIEDYNHLVNYKIHDLWHRPWPIICYFILETMSKDLDDIEPGLLYERFHKFVEKHFLEYHVRGNDMYQFNTLKDTCFQDNTIPGVEKIHRIDYKDLFIGLNNEWLQFFNVDKETMKQYSKTNLQQVLHLLKFTTDEFRRNHSHLTKQYLAMLD